MNVIVFDIQTVADIDGCRRLYELHGLADEDVVKAVLHMRRQQANTELLPHHLHKIVAISAVLRSNDQFKVWSLGDVESSEQDMLNRFYSGIERYSPILVSWNGGRLDLPVIHYRSLLYAINAGHYWESGSTDSRLRDNNYFGRYYDCHTDLKDALSACSSDHHTSLHEIACLCGFPGNKGVRHVNVQDKYLDGDIQSIRDYCETRVLNTYLLYLNFQRNRGVLEPAQYEQECALVRDSLKNSRFEHLRAFENHWINL